MHLLAALLRQLQYPLLGDNLFDAIPDIVFFVKDLQGRYVVVNHTLVERSGRKQKSDVLGLTAAEVFPGPIGESITEQDKQILFSGRRLNGVLERHLFPQRREGWCLTWKNPLISKTGEIVGLSGLSRDVRPFDDARNGVLNLANALHYVQHNLDQTLRLDDVAARAGLSGYQFDQRIRTLFGLSAGQYLVRLRIDHACDLLCNTTLPVSQIAQACGYADQTAFTRQFRKSVNLSPARYRDMPR